VQDTNSSSSPSAAILSLCPAFEETDEISKIPGEVYRWSASLRVFREEKEEEEEPVTVAKEEEGRLSPRKSNRSYRPGVNPNQLGASS